MPVPERESLVRESLVAMREIRQRQRANPGFVSVLESAFLVLALESVFNQHPYLLVCTVQSVAH